MAVFKKFVNMIKKWTKMPKNIGFWGKILFVFKRVLLVIFLSSVFVTVMYRFIPVYFTPLMAIRFVDGMSDEKTNRFERTWTPIENISPNMVNAVVASEDNRFLEHYGFDFKAISMARKMNKKGKKIYGASTISQQTAKNVFLWPSRTWFRKGLECYFTVLIELFWSKERIMEVYLNVAETGNGLYGAEAAARRYYKKSASELTKKEAAMIAACLPAPRRYNPSNPSSYLRSRQGKILRLMKNMKPVSFD